MPTYLLHGFRWPRPLVRIHIILQNLDDAAAEWLVAPNTTSALLSNFRELYPECMEYLPRLRFVEQYDPIDTSMSAASQPYAYVTDICEEVKLGAAVGDITTKGINADQWSAMIELRDCLAPEEEVTWYVVVCGDEERWAPPTAAVLENGSSIRAGSGGSGSYTNSVNSQQQPQTTPEEQARGLKKLFGSTRLARRKR